MVFRAVFPKMGGNLFAFRSNEKQPDIFEYVSELKLL